VLTRAVTAPLDLCLPDLAATMALAGKLAAVARPGDLIALHGTLGLGKTEFARAFIRRLAGSDEEVPSPTFTLVQSYETDRGTIWHFDLYRLTRPDEIRELGLEEALVDGITLIEWPERLGSALPARRLDVRLTPGTAPDERRAVLEARGGCDLLARLEAR
jgi:tRNA threonylcarbamoyladenosine biosynthesis protein TsaE